MDVHSKNYTLCAMEPVIGEEDRIFANIQVTADYKNVLMFIEELKLKLGLDNEYDIVCGYEAGCLGYSLYNQLTAAGVKCVILAPTTMLTQQGKRVKTDARDALMIAQCLSYGGYHAVYIPTEEDDSVKEYLRMRDDHKDALKKIKQQINALCLRLFARKRRMQLNLRIRRLWLVKLFPIYHIRRFSRHHNIVFRENRNERFERLLPIDSEIERSA